MYSKVLVPVSLAKGAETEKAFSMAKAFVGDAGEIHAVHVMETVPSFTSAYVPSDLTRQLADATHERFEKVVPSDVKTRELLHGSAGGAILDYAEKVGVDCIVIASHQPGLADYFLGSTAARVVRHAQCSVHVLR